MKAFKRLFATIATSALLFSSVGSDLHAGPYGPAGYGYFDGQNATNISPEMAFGGLLLLSVLIVALQNTDGGNVHVHGQ